MIDPTTITPTVDAVASYIRVRTRDGNGVEVGTFNDLDNGTRPTADEASDWASKGARRVALLLNPTDAWIALHTDDLTDCAAIYAAWRIEESFYTDGSTEEESLAASLEEDWTTELAALTASIENETAGSFQITSVKQIVDPAYTAPCCDEVCETGQTGGLYPSAPR